MALKIIINIPVFLIYLHEVLWVNKHARLWKQSHFQAVYLKLLSSKIYLHSLMLFKYIGIITEGTCAIFFYFVATTY